MWLFQAFREFTQHKLSQDLLLAAGSDRDWKLLGDRSARVGKAMSAYSWPREVAQDSSSLCASLCGGLQFDS